MPPMEGPAPPSSFSSTTMASVVIIRLATEVASYRAVLTTLVGSMIPVLNMSTYFPL
jgi:hypothetical protein